MFKLIFICGSLMAVVNGGLINSGIIGATGPSAIALQPAGLAVHSGSIAVPSVSSSSSNIIRGIGNLGAISASSNSVDTAFSSERNSDVRINNPDIQTTGILSYAPAIGGVPLTVSNVPSGYALAGPGLAASSVNLGLNGVALNGLGIGVNGYGLGAVNGYGLGVNGYGIQTLNGIQTVNGIGHLGLGGVKVL